MNPDASRPILIADADPVFKDLIQNQKQHPRFPTRYALTGADAQAQIADKSISLCGIFVSPNIAKPSWVSVLRAAHMHRPATPIYIVSNPDERIDDLIGVDFKKLGVRSVLQKPIPYKDMISLITPIVLSFNASEMINQSKQYDDIGTSMDKNFVPIRSDDFLSGSQSLFDVYVRLSNDKYIKLLHSGESFGAERIEKYLRKGVQYFYIRREVQEVYMSYCDHIATALLKMENVGTDVKLAQNMNLGEEVMKNLHTNGVNEMNVAYASKFVSNVKTVVDQVRKDVASKSTMMQQFLSQTALYEHGVATSMLAGLLSATLRISSDNPIQVVGMAGMFHDIALAGQPDVLVQEDVWKMNSEQIKIYQEHPKKAVEELSRLRLLNEGALQAIEQHHMRLGGKGFPARTGTTPVSRVADIIGISEEYARALAIQAVQPGFDMQKHIQKEIFPGFPREICRAFGDTFMPGNKAVLSS